MKTTICNQLIVAALTTSAVSFSSFAVHAQKASFSGDWKLDEAKSQLGEFGGRVARSLKADQKEDAITIARTTPGFNGGDPVTSSVTLTYDGKVAESEGFGGSKRKSSAKWSDDGQTLTITTNMTFERDGQTMEFKSTESWTIKDGQLTVATKSTSPRGDNSTTAIYHK